MFSVGCVIIVHELGNGKASLAAASRGTFSPSVRRTYIAGQLYLPVSCPKSGNKDKFVSVSFIAFCEH